MKCSVVTALNHKYAVMLFVSNGMFPQVSARLLSSQPSQNGAYLGREGDAKSCEDALRRSSCSYSYPVTWACSAYGFYWKGRLACSKTEGSNCSSGEESGTMTLLCNFVQFVICVHLFRKEHCRIFLIVYHLCAFILHTAQNEYGVGKSCPFIHSFQLHSKWEECVVIWYGVLHTKLFRKFGLVDIIVAYVVQTALESCKLRNCDRNTDFTINWFCTMYARNFKSHVKTYPEILESSDCFRVKWEN